MGASDEEMRGAVDEVLDPIWRRELRRVMGTRSLVGLLLALAVLWAFGIVYVVVASAAFPWSMFVFPGLLAGTLTLVELGHRRRQRQR